MHGRRLLTVGSRTGLGVLSLGLAMLALSGCGSRGNAAKSATVNAQTPPVSFSSATTDFKPPSETFADWDPSGSNRITYDYKESNGYSNVHVVNADGSDDQCLTCNDPDLPGKNAGSPAWSPDGQYIVFVAEKAVHGGSSYQALPGFGLYSDIYLMRVATKQVWRLYTAPNDSNSAILIPRFSPDGSKLVWANREKGGLNNVWDIRLADFTGGANPSISNVKILQPAGAKFYETYGFTPDGQRIIFNNNSTGHYDTYTCDLNGGNLFLLTSGITKNAYNEHGFFTPDGKHFLWMSSEGTTNGGTEWWIANADGTNPERLTYYNQVGSPDYRGGNSWATLGSFSPDGTRFVGVIQNHLIAQTGQVVIVDLKQG